jgi:hypothetical protein
MAGRTRIAGAAERQHEGGMKKSILLGAALLALSGCVSHNFAEGERTNWRCDRGKEFSLRHVPGAVEVYASGQTHRLAAAGGESYSNGAVTYSVDGGRAALTGVSNVPF